MQQHTYINVCTRNITYYLPLSWALVSGTAVMMRAMVSHRIIPLLTPQHGCSLSGQCLWVEALGTLESWNEARGSSFIPCTSRDNFNLNLFVCLSTVCTMSVNIYFEYWQITIIEFAIYCTSSFSELSAFSNALPPPMLNETLLVCIVQCHVRRVLSVTKIWHMSHLASSCWLLIRL